MMTTRSRKGWVNGLLVLVVLGMGAGRLAAADEAGADLLEQAYVLDAKEGGARDAGRAAELYQQAAAAGDAHAHLRLGYLYEVGDGVPQDYDRARRHYQQAVDLGLAEAGMRLAICHLEGWGGPADREAFLREMTRAAETGYAPAIRALAGVYFIGVGVERDEAAGRAWLERLATADDPDAQNQIGRSVERTARRNLTVEADRELARTWYQLSAEQDFAEAMRSMARSALQERRDPAHWASAKAWLELAAEGGDPESPFILGALSTRPGLAEQAEPGEARRWIELAAERSNGRAVEVLDRLEQGMGLSAAVRYVLSTPYSERYIQSYGERVERESAAQADGSRGPIPVRMVKPVFPRPLRLSETEGKAMISFVVDTTGRTRDVTCLEADHPLFGERAVSAVSLWRFKPARKDGRVVNVRMQVPIVFQFSPSDRFDGLDGLLDGVRHTATARGWVPEEPPQDFYLARPVGRPDRPVLPEGRTWPETWKVLLLLHIDAGGQPEKLHVVEANPEWMGEVIATMALAQRFHPVVVDGEPVPAWVVYPMSWPPRP